MFRKDLLRSVLLYLKTGGLNSNPSSRTCACYYRTITSKVLCSSRPHFTASNVTYVRMDRQPNKNWKMIVKSKLSKEGKLETSNENIVACEQGIEAVPHSILMPVLQNCCSVEEQINELCSKVSLTKEDIENRKNFAQSLQDLLMPFFPGIEVSLFGSSINGFGFKGCDCDISMDINGKFTSDASQVGVKKSGIRVEFPSVVDVESGKVPRENLSHLPPRLLLRFVRRVLREHCKDVSPNILLIKARHPVLRFYNKKYHLFCDFSLGKNSSLRNTRSIRLVGHLDNRVMPLIKILRYWGKHCKFIGDLECFNSYAFSLFVVYFLQNTSPPILPPFSELLEKSDYLNSGRVADDEMMFNDLKKFSPSKNTQTLEELLKEFFFYYMYFDFSQVICPFTSSSVPKMELMAGPEPFEFSTVSIQDPFQLTYNLSHAATDATSRLFLKSVLEACKSYQRSELWVPNPSIRWGLSSILDPLAQDEAATIETQPHHVIEIPLRTPTTGSSEIRVGVEDAIEVRFQKASKAVVDIFEYGLLFKCRTKKTNTAPKQNSVNEAEDYKKPILKLECTAFHNVLSGRSNWQGLAVPSSATNRMLETEHLISCGVSEDKNETGQALFSFDCELLESYKGGVPTLLVLLNFPKVNQPVVVVFLKEYLPRFVHQSFSVNI